MDGTISMYIWAALIRINGLLIKKESMKLREREMGQSGLRGVGGRNRWGIQSHFITSYMKLSKTNF